MTERIRPVRVDVNRLEDRLTSTMTDVQAVQLESLLRLARHGLRGVGVRADKVHERNSSIE